MGIQHERIRYLLKRYAFNEATESEIEELFEIIDESENDGLVREWLFQLIEETEPMADYDQEKWDQVGDRILQQVENKKFDARTGMARKLKRIAVAASLILVTGMAYWIYKSKGIPSPKSVAATPVISNEIKAPAINRAMITLSNGQKVYLDSVNQGTLAMQGNVQLVKLADGQVAYQAKNETGQGEIQYNTLYNPRGSKVVSITLSDGTRVWLNAESSLRYPTSFLENERKVEIAGEAYFEVSSLVSGIDKKKRPFIVKKGETEVIVLGTEFNVNAYDDESAVKVTLLQGSVMVRKGDAKGLLKPGEQATISSGIRKESDVDLEEVMAWKNGKFQFGESADIATVMHQISRWYDVDVQYEGSVSVHIGGTISRFENASQVFKMLEMTGAVKFRINGNKVTVMRK